MYVKSGLGTRTSATSFSAQETGAFGAGNLVAAAVYASYSDAILYNTIAHGDRINISHLSAKSGSLTAVSESAGTDPGDVVEVFVCSIDDADVTLLKEGAIETDTSASNDYMYGGKWMFNGFTHVTGDNMGTNAHGTHLTYNNCPITFDDSFSVSNDGCYIELNDCPIIFDDAGANNGFYITGGAKLVIRGGYVAGKTSAIDFLTGNASFVNGGAEVRLEGVDFTQGNGFSASAVIFPSVGNAGADDKIDLQAYGCKLSSGATWTDEEFTGMDHSLIVFGSGVSNDHTFHIKKRGGIVDHETTIVRTDGATFPDGSTRVSAKVVTNASTNLPTVYQPFRFELPVKHNDFSSGGNQTVRLYLTSDTVLTDADVFVICGYPDGTNATLLNYASSANVVSGSWTHDPWATGSTLTDGSAAVWASGKTYEYYIDIDTSGDEGDAASAMAPVIEINVTKANVTIYFDTEVGFI